MGLRKLLVLHVDKEKYYEYENEIIDSNGIVLRLFSLVATITFAAMAITSLFESTLTFKNGFYLAYSVISLIFFLASSFIKKSSNLSKTILVLFFSFIVLSFGIFMGTLFSPDQLTVSYIVLMMAVPMAFATRPIYMNSMIAISMAIYLFLARYTQSDSIFRSNLYDVIPYGILSMIVVSYMMKMKIQRIILKQQSTALEKTSEERRERIKKFDRFITDMIRYSSEEGDIEQIINQIMAYIGENLNSDRAYIFEENENGTYDNTYEWCKPGITAEKDNLQNLPYKGLIEVWIKEYKKSHNILIYDIEKYKAKSQAMYDLLKPQGIVSLVTGPITINGKIVGFYGVDNPPESSMHDISELIHINEFVISMMIRLRNNAKSLEKSALYDQLTGCKNRKALEWAYDGKYNREDSLAIIMCDLNGLKEVNDKQGHEAGDKFICRLVEALSDVFEKNAIYRLGGDEFLIILTGKTREEIDELISLCRLQIGNIACLGLAFKEKAGNSFVDMMKSADAELYKEKDLFYQTRKRYREV